MKKLMTGLVFIFLVLNLSAEKIKLLNITIESTGIHEFHFYCIDGYKYVVLVGDSTNGTLTQMFEHRTVWGDGGAVPITCSNK